MTKIPVLFVRYEDMIPDPKKAFTDIMKFLLATDDISGTVVEKLIDLSIETKQTAYKPRVGGAGSVKNFDKYTSEQIKSFYETAKRPLDFFGYTDIFTQEKQNDLTQFNEINSKALQQSIDLEESEDVVRLYVHDP